MYSDQSTAADPALMANSAALSYGFSDGTDSFCVSGRDLDNQDITESYHNYFDGIARNDVTSGSDNGKATYSNASDGFDLVWTSNDGTNRLLYALSIGDASSTGYDISLDSGSFSYSGQDLGLKYNRVISLDSGAYSYAGQSISILANRLINIESGNYSYSGQELDLLRGYEIQMGSGSFSYLGQNLSLIAERVIDIDSGAYSYIGQPVTLDYSGFTAVFVDEYTISFKSDIVSIDFKDDNINVFFGD
jgi:hypothetical protein